MKRFTEQFNIAYAKYVVNFHDGVKAHKDGSPFYDICLFKNKREKDRFVQGLKRQGYTEGK